MNKKSISEDIKTHHVDKTLELVKLEILRADKKFGFLRDNKLKPSSMHIDEFRNYTLMIPSEKNAKNIVDRHAKDGTLTWAQIIIEELTEVVQSVEPHEAYEELIQLAGVAINAAIHLKKDLYLERDQNPTSK